MGPEGDVPGSRAVVHGRFDRPGVHAAEHGVQDDAAVDLDALHHLLDHPGGSHGHVEDVHDGKGPHSGVTGFNCGLDGVGAPRTAEKMGTGMNMKIDGAFEEFFAFASGAAELP
ncbi:hypothetical protein SDC9_208768 [bioreactor metagenome]|uniref:Uncharacterized protein n=1 Tax=bioreactor metagenome TaxID=1076179 RepID=A0A645JL32_9ZZZZ